LEPNSRCMQKPIEGRVVLPAASTKNNVAALYKGAIAFPSTTVHRQHHGFQKNQDFLTVILINIDRMINCCFFLATQIARNQF